MSLKLTREGLYGYVSVLIARSPDLMALSNVVESGETVDLQTAISRGLLDPGYSVLLQARTIEDVDDSVNSLYRRLLSEVAKLAPNPYDGYVDRLLEAFDIDKAVSLVFSTERQRLRIKHMVSRIEPLIDYITYRRGAGGGALAYGRCVEVGRGLDAIKTVECFVGVYVERVLSALDSVSRLEPTGSSLTAFYEFALLRLYRYSIASRLLKTEQEVRLEEFAKRMRVPKPMLSKVSEDLRRLGNVSERDLATYTVYELRSAYDRLKSLLYTPHSLIDRLTYLVIGKFYEAMLVRYLATRGRLWG